MVHKPNTEPVQFDHGKADALIAAFKNAKQKLNENMERRSSAQSKASKEFSGRYAEIFGKTFNRVARDAQNIQTAMDDAVSKLEKYKEAARIEQENRNKVKEWEEREEKHPRSSHKTTINSSAIYRRNFGRENQNTTDKPEINENGPTFNVDSGSADATPVSPRDVSQEATYQEWSKDAQNNLGMDRSSAVPEDLDFFVSTTKEANEKDATNLRDIATKYDDFVNATKWGKFDAKNLLQAFMQWIGNNAANALWIEYVAELFRMANERGIYTLDSSMLKECMDTDGVSSYVVRKELGGVDERGRPWSLTNAKVYGASPSSGYVNDPVNVANGNFIEDEQDLAFHGTAATALRLERMYNSLAAAQQQDAFSGVFGLGWFSTLDQHLDVGQQQAAWYGPDGRVLLFPRKEQGYTRAVGHAMWLNRAMPGEPIYEQYEAARACAAEQLHALSQSRDNESNITTGHTPEPFYWVASDNKHHVTVFTPSGVWIGNTESHPGNTVIALRNNAGAVTDLVHPGTCRGIHITYAEAEQSAAETLHPVTAYTFNTTGKNAGKPLMVAEYAYSGVHLNTVTTNAGVRTYTHTPAGLIHRVINVNGHTEVTNTYDDRGRVTGQTGELGREVTYAYLPGGMALVADACPDNSTEENHANAWVSDSRGRLIGLIAADGRRQSMRYDSFSNRVSVTEPDGTTTYRSSDERGRLTRERTGEGADCTYSWDEHDRITAVTVADMRDQKYPGAVATTSYTYADESSLYPATVTDATGATTHYTWDEHGNPTSVTDATEVRTTYGYDTRGDLISITNGAGDTMHLTRDDAGQVVAVTDPYEHTSRFMYTAAGALSSITDPSGARWTFTYPATNQDNIPALIRNQHLASGATNRLGVGFLPETVTNPAGNTTRLTYHPNGQVATVTDPAGNTTTNVMNVWGNLARVITAGGGV